MRKIKEKKERKNNEESTENLEHESFRYSFLKN